MKKVCVAMAGWMGMTLALPSCGGYEAAAEENVPPMTVVLAATSAAGKFYRGNVSRQGGFSGCPAGGGTAGVGITCAFLDGSGRHSVNGLCAGTWDFTQFVLYDNLSDCQVQGPGFDCNPVFGQVLTPGANVVSLSCPRVASVTLDFSNDTP